MSYERLNSWQFYILFIRGEILEQLAVQEVILSPGNGWGYMRTVVFIYGLKMNRRRRRRNLEGHGGAFTTLEPAVYVTAARCSGYQVTRLSVRLSGMQTLRLTAIDFSFPKCHHRELVGQVTHTHTQKM